IGPDSHRPVISASPEFRSAQSASEMGECYWHALARDIPFAEYGSNQLTIDAAADLSKFSDFRGPKQSGMVTPATLFRGETPGALLGEYISQFLWLPIPYGGLNQIEQSYVLPDPGIDYMTDYNSWLAIQRGAMPASPIIPLDESNPRYIQTGRDLSFYVHLDFPGQAHWYAGLILLGYGPAAFDANNFYLGSAIQAGFVTQDIADILAMIPAVAQQALKAAWYQKWLVHRRLRPEAFGGRIHNHRQTQDVSYEINQEILDSEVLGRIFSIYRTYLLPQAYPEGSPAHPSYPAGHAAIAGAITTILKAFFREDFVIPDPVVPSSDGKKLSPYIGPDLTIGGELNKLAHNISLGRDFAGVHYRSEGYEGMLLGEQIAIGFLQDLKCTYTERFGNGAFSFTRFDGTPVTI
ncbi:MAG: vanadium-dependent haloperoxidase, partial [bacterium]